MSTLASVFGYGLLSARAAASVAGRFYYATDTTLMYRDNGSTWDTLSVGLGSMATDALWDVAGDLAVGSGANTAARLAKGAAGGALSMINAVVAWNSGTSFPGSAVAGDRYWRTDHGREYFYDGAQWLSTQTLILPLTDRASASPPATTGLNATTATPVLGIIPVHAGSSDIYLVDHWAVFFVNGGTALSGSHKWVGTFGKLNSANALTTIATDTIDSGASSAWRRITDSVNALVTQGTYFKFATTWTKTGTPGDLIVREGVSYRIVAT